MTAIDVVADVAVVAVAKQERALALGMGHPPAMEFLRSVWQRDPNVFVGHSRFGGRVEYKRKRSEDELSLIVVESETSSCVGDRG